VLVGDHDAAVGEQPVHQLGGRRRVEDRHGAGSAGAREGIGDDVDRDLQLGQHDAGRRQGGGQQRGVGARHDDDRVLPGGIDGDQRSARRRPDDPLHGGPVDPLGVDDGREVDSGVVIAERGDERASAAGAPRGDGLVEALAARILVVLGTEDRLAGRRMAQGGDDEVEVAAADDANVERGRA
jgi:hypothetical protein